MSASNPNVRRQRALRAEADRRIAVLNAELRAAGAPTLSEADMQRVRADIFAAARPAAVAPETSTVADRRAKRARRHEGVKALFKAAGVALPEDNTQKEIA